MPLLFVSATLIDFDAMPRWMQWAARLNPVQWAVDAGREPTLPETDWGLAGLSLALLVGFTALTSAFAMWSFRAYQRTLRLAPHPPGRRKRMADDPRDSVPDDLENRLDDLSATLTDGDVHTTGASAVGTRAMADSDGDDTDTTDGDAGDDTDATDQDADADDA